MILCASSYLATVYFLDDYLSAGMLDETIIQGAVVYAVIMMLSTLAMGVYGSGLTESFISMAVKSLVSYCLLGSLACLIIFNLFSFLRFETAILFETVLISLLAVLLVRRVFYSLVDHSKLQRRIFVLGAGEKARQLRDAVTEQSLSGFSIVGFIPADRANCKLPDEKILNPVEGLYELTRRHAIDEVVVAVDDRRRGKDTYFPLDELLECKMNGVRVTEVVTFYERECGVIELSEVYQGWMVFGSGFKYSQLRDFLKRVFDISVSLILVAIAWPAMILTAVAIALESGFPVIYKQQRVGLRGESFWIYKFRSMGHDAEKGGKAIWARQNDSRITRVGAFIRNTRLDELPQIYNVLKGDMSFVGPRPERPEFVDELNERLDYYQERHSVRPGLMGWAQLKYSYGASYEDAANKLKYDLYYVKNHSFMLDVLIVVQSIEVILLGKGVR